MKVSVTPPAVPGVRTKLYDPSAFKVSVPYWPATTRLPALSKVESLPPKPETAETLAPSAPCWSTPAAPLVVPVPVMTLPVSGP